MRGGGGLVGGAEPADEAALFLGGAFVVQGGEAGEEGLLQGFGILVGRVEAVGEGDGWRGGRSSRRLRGVSPVLILEPKFFPGFSFSRCDVILISRSGKYALN